MLDVRRREFITLLGGGGGGVAARGARAAAGDAGYRVSRRCISNFGPFSRTSAGPEGGRLCRGRERFDRVPLGRRRIRQIARAGGRIGPQTGFGHRPGGNAAAFAAKAATTTVPIVFILTEDPVHLGLVASIPRPGGNATGINVVSGELTAKRLELLHELVPAAARVSVLVNPADPTAMETTLRDLEPAARAIGLKIQVLKITTSQEIHAAFAAMVREQSEALFLGSDPFFTSRRVQLATLSARHGIPLASQAREIAEAGGLMSYGANIADGFRQAGVYTGRILKGAKPADLPVVQSSKFELVINAETARILGLAVPPTLLASADEVIE
jgi:ABC-type uncharacterized transport system substrate-binding protein